MNDEIKEALRRFNREDLIDDGYERDLDSNIEVFLTIKQMIYYNQLQSNWNSLKEYIGAEWYCFDNESVEHEVANSILDKMNELESSDNK